MYFDEVLDFSNMAFIIPSHFSNVPYLNTEQLLILLSSLCKSIHLALTFSIWLKCWPQQTLSQG